MRGAGRLTVSRFLYFHKTIKIYNLTLYILAFVLNIQKTADGKAWKYTNNRKPPDLTKYSSSKGYSYQKQRVGEVESHGAHNPGTQVRFLGPQH